MDVLIRIVQTLIISFMPVALMLGMRLGSLPAPARPLIPRCTVRARKPSGGLVQAVLPRTRTTCSWFLPLSARRTRAIGTTGLACVASPINSHFSLFLLFRCSTPPPKKTGGRGFCNCSHFILKMPHANITSATQYMPNATQFMIYLPGENTKVMPHV